MTIIIKGALNPLLLAAVELCHLNMKAAIDSYNNDYDDDDYDDDYDDYDDDYDSDDSTVVINGKRVYVPSSQR